MRRRLVALVFFGACDRSAIDAEPTPAPAEPASADPALADPAPAEPAPDPVVAPTVVAPTEPQPHGFALIRPGATVFLGKGPARDGAAPSIVLPSAGAGFVVAAVGREGSYISVETPLDDVPTCAGSLSALWAFRLQLHVAQDDLVSVTTRRVAADFGDGTRVELLSGVPMRREAEGWIATLGDLGVAVTIPDDAVGRFYDRGERSFGDAPAEQLAEGDESLVYDRTHELPDARLIHSGFGPARVATYGRVTEGGRTLADVRMHCASFRAIVPASRTAPVAEPEAAALVGSIAAMSGAGGSLFGGSGPTWQVRRGATVSWRSGGIAGLVEHDHMFTTAAEIVGEKHCFPVELGPGSVLPLCFEASGVEEVPGSSSDPLGGLGMGIGRTGELGGGLAGELGGVLGGELAGESGGAIAGGLGTIGSGGAKPPSVRPGTAAVTGSLDKDVIRRIVRAHINEVRFCYEQGLTKDPSLAGKVTAAFTISPDGSVSTSSIKDSTISDPKVEGCIEKAVKRWKFPEPAGGGLVAVRYPFVLRGE